MTSTSIKKEQSIQTDGSYPDTRITISDMPGGRLEITKDNHPDGWPGSVVIVAENMDREKVRLVIGKLDFLDFLLAAIKLFLPFR